MAPMTKFELYYSNEILNDPEELIELDDDNDGDIDWVVKDKRKADKAEG